MKFKGFFSFFDYTFKIIVFTLLPIAVFTLVTSKIPIFGIQSFVVLSGSMEPTLPVGSIVYAKNAKIYDIKDVISYKMKSGQVVTHRIMEIVRKPEEIFYRVKGDANNAPDNQLVASKDVLGEAVTLVPYLGYLVAFTKTLTGLIVLIIVPAIVFVGFELWNIKREMEKEVERRVMTRMQTQ